MDLPASARPPAGHRPRRPRAQAVPLSPALARGARRGEIRPAARVRGGAARRCATASPPICGAAGLPREKVRGHGGRAPRAHADPRRQRGVRARQPLVRTDHAAQRPRQGERVERDASSSAARAASSTASACSDARLARIVKACRDLPGYELFQYVDEAGERCAVDSSDVNDYVREACGEAFTAKDFRTWAGHGARGARACRRAAAPPRRRRRNGRSCRRSRPPRDRLGNTVAVCRKCYVHPAVARGFLEGDVIGPAKRRAGAGRTALGRRGRRGAAHRPAHAIARAKPRRKPRRSRRRGAARAEAAYNPPHVVEPARRSRPTSASSRRARSSWACWSRSSSAPPIPTWS